MPDEPERLAIIECSICTAWIDVFREPETAEIAWTARNAELCQHPPLQSCRQARIEISRSFPGETIL